MFSKSSSTTRVVRWTKQLGDPATKESEVLKILQQLSTIDMTLEVLQTTHIGKAVNSLRKRGGAVSSTAKSLVKQWKQLLPSAGHTDSPQHSEGPSPRRTRSSSISTRSSPHCPSNETPSSRTINNHTRPASVQHSLTVPRHTQGPLRARSPGVSGTGETRARHAVPEVQGSPMRATSSPGSSMKKRKGAVLDAGEDLQVVAALSKRSRTQVYSGRSFGLKAVPSLFSMCMGILINNIDVIETVGDIPYFILEPMLQRCTPTQLMRLEEYNPHFIEDSDVLWQKHCQKEFKVINRNTETWRELYIERLAEREQKMRSITDSIKAKQKAREEPVRKAILAAVPMSISRRSRQRGGFSSNHSYSGGGRGGGGGGNSLMKQTMKMARERQSMTTLNRRK